LELPFRWKKPPVLLPKSLLFPRDRVHVINRTIKKLIVMAPAIHGWYLMLFRARKKKCKNLEPFGFGVSLGGDDTILGSVSSIDVRDGTMAFPVMV